MAKPDLKRNTDVPATIAGFYFQIILACREICMEHVEQVGVETGADIVVIDDNKYKTYIETKLHSRNFNCFSRDVIKTIYNFYSSYKKSEQIKKMIFLTNVGIAYKNKSLFDTWGTVDIQKIQYIKKAILRQSVETSTECKKMFEQFCAKFSKEKKDLLDDLIKEVFNQNSAYKYLDYAIENSDCSYDTFIEKTKFIFLNKKKVEVFEAIEKETEEKIAKDYLQIPENIQKESISEEGAKLVFSRLVKIFFDCIVENSQKGTKRYIFVKEYQDCLSDYYANKETSKAIKEAKQVNHWIKMLAYDEEEFLEELDLEQEEDRVYQECYSNVKTLFLNKIQEEKGDLAFE